MKVFGVSLTMIVMLLVVLAGGFWLGKNKPGLLSSVTG